jgi:aryl-phospho-beta-D-glucosidase BglC (GH1 family)
VPAWYYADNRFPTTRRGLAAAEAAFWTTEATQSQAYYTAFVQMMVKRYSAYPNVMGYEIFNEPHPGTLGTSPAATSAILRWQVPIRDAIATIDPYRTVFVQCRGGGEGVGSADLSVFGSMTHLALDFHDYFDGVAGYGLDQAGDNWSPSWTATHNQNVTSYSGTEASQEAVLAVPIQKAAQYNIPLLIGEWGARTDDTNEATYQRQMLDLFNKYGLSWTRWDIGKSDRFHLLNPDYSFTPGALQIQQALTGAG